MTGQRTLYHDHGGASEAAFVCSGVLIEDVVEAVDGHVIRRHTSRRRAESAFSFGPDYIHRVRHDPLHGVALSIHAYTSAGATRSTTTSATTARSRSRRTSSPIRSGAGRVDGRQVTGSGLEPDHP